MVRFEDLKYLSGDFTEQYCKAINDNSEYAKAAKGWGVDFEGSILYLMEASGEIEDDISIYMDLKNGKCLGIKLLAPNERPPRNPGLIIKGSLLIWNEIATRQITAMNAIMSGKLKLEGKINLIMRYSQAAKILAKIAGKQSFFKILFNQFKLI
ncbi:MAG: SCP2 sterol-binding domain-containing protein [Candidatus Thorarchaeota archaeon]